MATKNEKDCFIRELSDELREGNLALFGGAGLSVSAVFVNWADLLKPIAQELCLDIEKETTDLASLAQYHCNNNANNRDRLNKLLINKFSPDVKNTTNHKILAGLPISTYWTTNYDNLLEKALTEAGKMPDVKCIITDLAITKPGRDAIVYKMHGDAANPAKAVLTKNDYEKLKTLKRDFSCDIKLY